MSDTGVYLLFAPGERPCRKDLADFIKASPKVTLGHDPFDRAGQKLPHANDDGQQLENGEEPLHWIELIRDGLTFDLKGMMPGQAAISPEFQHAFDIADRDQIMAAEALVLEPGPHILGGERSIPVVRGQLALVCDFLQLFESIEGVVWPPSQSVIGRRYFESTISAWLEGGAFPALGLTAFSEVDEGGLKSTGLSHFIGSELRIEPPLSQDKVAATRLGIRLVNQLILIGGISGEEHVIAPDGTRLIMRESDDRRFIRVWADKAG